MNHKRIVKLSNTIGIISIILLLYWVFVFVSITVFGLKVFRANLTETFYLSIVGILALMLGALIVNVMLNLTRIAEKHNVDEVHTPTKGSKKIALLFALSFPIIGGLLFGGDYLTSKKKEQMLIESAKSIIEGAPDKTETLLHYAFTKEWLIKTNDILDLYSETDKNFPHVSVIVVDSIGGTRVFLGFWGYSGDLSDTTQPMKKNFIHETTKVERDYLNSVFLGNTKEVRFSAYNGRYELFYPILKDGKKIVLYFSDYQRYGKLGS